MRTRGRRSAAGSSRPTRGTAPSSSRTCSAARPTNLTLPFLRKDRVEIVTGVNLPMVLKCASLQRSGRPVTEVAHVAKDRGQRSIYVASDLLAEEAAPTPVVVTEKEP